jgi:transcriptional regulator of arginine metabolism
MNRSGNIILVKTIEATAAAVGQAIDALALPGILGTVAGDDAVLVVVREGTSSQEILETLRKIAGL